MSKGWQLFWGVAAFIVVTKHPAESAATVSSALDAFGAFVSAI